MSPSHDADMPDTPDAEREAPRESQLLSDAYINTTAKDKEREARSPLQVISDEPEVPDPPQLPHG